MSELVKTTKHHQIIQSQSIKQWLDGASQQLKQALNDSDARSEARILLTHALQKQASYLHTWP